MGVIGQMQQSSASAFSAMQTTFGSTMANAQKLIQQSGSQLLGLLQKRDTEAEKLQASSDCSHNLALGWSVQTSPSFARSCLHELSCTHESVQPA